MNFVVRIVFLAACLAAAQSSPPAAEKNAQAVPADLASVVKQQFGPTFALKTKFPTPLIVADFDGDGVEDAAIVAFSSEPFPDSFAFKYQVIDPYDAYFGMSNPAEAASFSSEEPSHRHDLLIIFGSGPEGWHAAVPKAKFVVLNLPFDDISVGRMLIKKNKPPIFVIKAHESQIMDSAIWWDVKKKRWHWQPGDMLQ